MYRMCVTLSMARSLSSACALRIKRVFLENKEPSPADRSQHKGYERKFYYYPQSYNNQVNKNRFKLK